MEFARRYGASQGAAYKLLHEEIDCDRFLALLGPYLDGQVGEAQLREQITHHAGQCPEGAEELEILKRALGRAADLRSLVFGAHEVRRARRHAIRRVDIEQRRQRPRERTK